MASREGSRASTVRGACDLVFVSMVHVRIMRVAVCESLVTVPMAVRFSRRIVRAMCVPVMRVMVMQMLVLHHRVHVFVLVAFGQVQA